MVIIAEDDLISRRIIGKAVSDLGYEYVFCSNGRIAWELMMDNPQAKLLISDIAMPEKDGKELIKLTQAHPELKKIPIVIVSGVLSLREIDEVLSMGASRFLPKPVDVAILKDYVDYYCKSE